MSPLPSPRVARPAFSPIAPFAWPKVLSLAASVAALLASAAGAGCESSASRARLPEPVASAGPAADPHPATKASAPAIAQPAPGEPSGQPAAEPASASGRNAFTGTTEPHRRTTLMPRVGGPVAQVHVREGDRVKKGAALVSIDPAQYRLMLRQAEAGLAGARVQLDALKLEWDRQKTLLAERAVSQGQYDMVDAKYRGAVIAVQAAEVTLDMARKAARDAVVRAPYTGVVTRKHVSEGDMATSMPPTALITIEEIEILDLRLQVPAALLERAHVGDPVVVRFPSLGKELRAVVSRVVPSINPNTRTFSVIIEIDNSAGEYRAGLFAEVWPAAARAGDARAGGTGAGGAGAGGARAVRAAEATGSEAGR